MHPVKVFVYGTLKRGYGLNGMLRECEFLGEAVTERTYRMIHVGYPVITADGDGHKVVGELYLVKDAYTLARLDSIEGAYDRTPVQVTLKNGGPIDCQVYEGKPQFWAHEFMGTGNRRSVPVLPNEHGEIDWQRTQRGDLCKEEPLEVQLGKNSVRPRFDNEQDDTEFGEPEDQSQGDVLGLHDEREQP